MTSNDDGINFENRTLFHADNLDILRGMNSESVDLIATDPPFNKGKDFHATPDSLASGASFHDRWSWSDDVHYDWLGEIEKNSPSVWSVIMMAKTSWGNDMGAFLCYMAVRLMEMHRVLKEEGSIYLHCDPTASHYLKAVMDAVFGKDNFRNEITWQRTESHNNAKKYGNIADILLFYWKSKKGIWNRQYHRYESGQKYSEEQMKRFRHKDENGRLYRLDDLTAPSANNGSRRFEWRGTTPGPTRVWGHSLEQLEKWWDEGRIHLKRDGTPRMDGLKSYLDESKGKPLQNIWTDVPRVSNTSAERTGYPTQKPLALYERIIKTSSNEGDMVLDPFCGCATTPIAAEKLGRQWVGIDIWDGAYDEVVRRMKDEAWRGVAEETQMGMGLYPIHYKTSPPVRTDGKEEAAPFMLSMTSGQRTRYPPIREQKVELLRELGPVCQGCGRDYEDDRVLEVDHIMPKSDGGTDAYANLTLLCPPCNKLKRDQLTLSGLQEINRKEGYMYNEARIKVGAAPRRARRRKRK